MEVDLVNLLHAKVKQSHPKVASAIKIINHLDAPVQVYKIWLALVQVFVDVSQMI
jgi:hypothetical protein